MDNHRIWIYADATGKPLAAWCQEDPYGDDLTSPIKPVVMAPGSTITKFLPADLAGLNLPASDVAVASAYIAANGLKPENVLYRALQLHSSDDAPSQWILENCRITAGKLGRFLGEPSTVFDTPIDPAKETPGMLAKIWRGMVNLFGP